MASAGHVYGKRIIGAEAFTSGDQEPLEEGFIVAGVGAAWPGDNSNAPSIHYRRLVNAPRILTSHWMLALTDIKQ